MKLRMVPVGPTFRHFVRIVRDVALAHGKLARLVIEGVDVEVDTTIIQHLRDPLTHLVRNALSHGIEAPSARSAAGKEPSGPLTLRAFHEAGNIVIELTDDGAGLDREKILARACERGLLEAGEVPSDDRLHRFLFEPGCSTADAVDDLSGRGVGLDVVARRIEALRGSALVKSERGAGTTFTIRLPLTVAIIDGFGVGVADETYIIPLDSVVECLELPEQAESLGAAEGVVSLRGQPLPFVRLRDIFELGGERPPRENIVVVRCDSALVGVVVDVLHGDSQTVIKPLGRMLRGLPGIVGSAVLGSGRVALILDVPDLVRRRVLRRSSAEAHSRAGL
jgi:two-component system chemotaxis sensor kinase CheA